MQIISFYLNHSAEFFNSMKISLLSDFSFSIFDIDTATDRNLDLNLGISTPSFAHDLSRNDSSGFHFHYGSFEIPEAGKARVTNLSIGTFFCVN